jgi:hemin uptake protein HemP
MAEHDRHDQDQGISREEKPSLPLRSQTLFQGKREIVIEHEGQHYRLRITRRNKLILQK